MKYQIKKVSVSDTKKDGTKLVDKNGKPYYKVGIQVAEFGETWINGLFFGSKPTWQDGDEVDLEIKDEEYQGRISKKFEIPKKEDKLAHELNSLGIKVGLMNAKLDKLISFHEKPVKQSEMRNSDGSEVPFPND